MVSVNDIITKILKVGSQKGETRQSGGAKDRKKGRRRGDGHGLERRRQKQQERKIAVKRKGRGRKKSQLDWIEQILSLGKL